MEDIELKVKKIVAEQLGIKEEDIKNESSFIEDLGADSLTTVEMSLALEGHRLRQVCRQQVISPRENSM